VVRDYRNVRLHDRGGTFTLAIAGFLVAAFAGWIDIARAS
jgi:hypothetical protein